VSVRASLWVSDRAPVSDLYELAILSAMALWADETGRGVWPSMDRLAARSRQSVRTVQRRMRVLEERGLIAKDPHHQDPRWLAIEPRRRPTMWRLCLDDAGAARRGVPQSPLGEVRGDCGGVSGVSAQSPNTELDTKPKEPPHPHSSDGSPRSASAEGGAPGKTRKAPAKTQLPPDWQPSEKDLAWAAETIPSFRHAGALDDAARSLELETAAFVEYFTQTNPERRPGWSRSWQGWMRRAADRAAQRDRVAARDARELRAVGGSTRRVLPAAASEYVDRDQMLARMAAIAGPEGTAP
jgi:hypothetical protein